MGVKGSKTEDRSVRKVTVIEGWQSLNKSVTVTMNSQEWT